MSRELKIRIPSNWNDVSLSQYQKYVELENPTTEDIIELFCGINKSQLRLLEMGSIDEIFSVLSTLLSSEIDNMPLIYNLELNAKKYGFIPNLNDISYGEYVDLTQNIGDWKTMDKAMAVLYRQIDKTKGKQYSLKPYSGEEWQDENIKDLPMGVVFSSMVFFYNLMKQLLVLIPNYMVETEQQMEQTDKAYSPKIGEHMKQLTNSLGETLQDLTKLLP